VETPSQFITAIYFAVINLRGVSKQKVLYMKTNKELINKDLFRIVKETCRSIIVAKKSRQS
jgi:hypothetical protein